MLLFLFNPSFCQNMAQDSVDMKSIALDTSASMRFIDLHTKPVAFNRIDLIVNEHPLSTKKINRKEIKTGYTFCGIPVTELYAYKASGSSYCLYLIIDFASDSFLSTIVSNLGAPENATQEELKKGDFDFLFWPVNNLEIWLSKEGFGSYANRVNNRVTLIFTNMEFSDLLDTERIF